MSIIDYNGLVDMAKGIALQTDGKIVLAGSAEQTFYDEEENPYMASVVAVARVNPAGGTTRNLYYTTANQVIEEREGSAVKAQNVQQLVTELSRVDAPRHRAGTEASRRSSIGRNTSEPRQRRARPEDASSGRASFATGCYGLGYVNALVLRDNDLDANSATGNLGVSSSGLEDREYAQYDANYDVTSIVGYNSGPATWTVQEHYVYGAYGDVTYYNNASPWATISSSAKGSVYLFQGGRIDPQTGNYYFLNRDLSPILGSWMSADPAGYVDGMSLYQGFGTNPVNLVDPRGLASVLGNGQVPKRYHPVPVYNEHAQIFGQVGYLKCNHEIRVYREVDYQFVPTGKYLMWSPWIGSRDFYYVDESEIEFPSPSPYPIPKPPFPVPPPPQKPAPPPHTSDELEPEHIVGIGVLYWPTKVVMKAEHTVILGTGYGCGMIGATIGEAAVFVFHDLWTDKDPHPNMWGQIHNGIAPEIKKTWTEWGPEPQKPPPPEPPPPREPLGPPTPDELKAPPETPLERLKKLFGPTSRPSGGH